MKPLELAKKYMDIVFGTNDFDQLRYILADNLQFRGPLYSFDTANDYINSMLESPPQDFKYELIKTYESRTSACLVYKFSKPGVSTIMTQVFETDNKKIKTIILVFDTAAFNQ